MKNRSVRLTAVVSFGVALLHVLVSAPSAQSWRAMQAVPLTSLKPEAVLGKLDLSRPGLKAVKAAADRGDRAEALAELLAYYRTKFPAESYREGRRRRGGSLDRADKIVRHIFQWGPYDEADYGPEMDWASDPRGDIEWVASMYRFSWARPLASAYRQTADEKYVQAFVDLTTDWVRKHPLEQKDVIHPVYARWRGYPWLDIQTGRRASAIISAFPALVHGESFTPDFLAVLLASLYDHQVKSVMIPMGMVHNKAIFELRGIVEIADAFDEFKESGSWLQTAMDRAHESLLAQTTTDGVQREWSFGYHTGVMRDAVTMLEAMEKADISVPQEYRDRIRLMYDYIFAVTTPDLGAPMFGDASRRPPRSDDRTTWGNYRTLTGASELLGDPKYAARANLDRSALPAQKNYAFPEAGMYVMRSDWGSDQVHLGLHCSPRGISSHDQPDNGTFELYAYGRWLMPDTGFFTYGHDPEARRWHRKTAVHNTLTVDNRDTEVAGRHLLWKDDGRHVALVVENASYSPSGWSVDGGPWTENPVSGLLVHRRTVWFVDGRFVVLLDEAIGDVEGKLALHFQLAPDDSGKASTIDAKGLAAHTAFKDANVLVAAAGDRKRLTLTEEEGWHAWTYGSRVPRKAFRIEKAGSAPAAFLTVLVPYRGTDVPKVKAKLRKGFKVGDEKAEAEVEVFGEKWNVGRDLGTGEGWVKR